MSQTRLAVALDLPDSAAALQCALEFKGLDLVLKVGLELFSAGGPDLIRQLGRMGFPLFLDLKLHDIPQTVGRAVARIKELDGVQWTTIHLSGGRVMAERALESAGPDLQILGVTVLTSFDDATWSEVTQAVAGTQSSIEPSQSALRLAKQAEKWGISGVVCSPLEVESIRSQCKSLFTVVPGIRRPDSKGPSRDDQSRTCGPREAAERGAGMIVVGRPILESQNRRETAEWFLSQCS